ncbi:MAG TPA: PKD domain-containing protein [Mycobacteriales bacterium]|nr:PKD domain-containing protein [Mycobacteriales bacterium]
MAAPPALAQPANDELAGATVVDTVPFSTTEDTSEATSDPTDPVGCFNTGSVWFSYTPPSDTTVVADTFGSSYDTVLSAWTGTPGALDLIACNDDFNGLQSQVTFPATAGTAIYFMVGVCCSDGGTGGGSLTFSVNQIASPGNDAFAAAGPIASLPFSSTVDLAAATTEAGEPAPSCTTLQNTVWYSFTPTTTRALSASLDQSIGGVGVYTGTSLSNLSQVGCGYGSTSALVQAQANTTYYFQVGSVCCGAGPVTFRVDVAPDPVAGFSFSPSEPSVFDPVQFFDQSHDPAGGTISTVGWSFGDGATATGCCPTHQYASDGDYTVRLTVTTTDGRTASTSQVVRVRTHDVAVVQVAVPNSAHVGQTIAVNVHLRNTRYAETVRVDLYKSAPGGFQQVGALTQFVPVRPPGGNTTRFAFTYTVSPADGTIRKVSFRAVATIVDHPDALPGDNELISPPVRIT